MILDLIQTPLYRVSVNEIHTACPYCGGRDRFIIFLDRNQFFCRQCRKKGDEIQLLRDIKGMTFTEASEAIGKPINRNILSALSPLPKPDQSWKPKPLTKLNDQWIIRASSFIQRSQEELQNHSKIINWLKAEKGLTEKTIKSSGLGFIAEGKAPKEYWHKRAEWGLPEGESGVWIPEGVLIPYCVDRLPMKIRVRRFNPKPNEPRYVVVSGSAILGSIYGTLTDSVVVVESELDGILLNQEAGDLVTVIAIGSASYRPDVFSANAIRDASKVLIALDADEEGDRTSREFYLKEFPHAKRWTPINGKDPSDSLKNGVDLRAWVIEGLTQYDAPEASGTPSGQTLGTPSNEITPC